MLTEIEIARLQLLFPHSTCKSIEGEWQDKLMTAGLHLRKPLQFSPTSHGVELDKLPTIPGHSSKADTAGRLHENGRGSVVTSGQ